MAEGGQRDCSNYDQHELFVWDASAGHGGFVAAGMKRSWDDEEDAAEDGLATGESPSQHTDR